MIDDKLSLIRKRLIEKGITNIVDGEKIELLLESFPSEPADRSDMRRARALEKKTVRLYGFLPHVIYIETLNQRNFTKIFHTNGAHHHNRMDECGRISFTSRKRNDHNYFKETEELIKKHGLEKIFEKMQYLTTDEASYIIDIHKLLKDFPEVYKHIIPSPKFLHANSNNFHYITGLKKLTILLANDEELDELDKLYKYTSMKNGPTKEVQDLLIFAGMLNSSIIDSPIGNDKTQFLTQQKNGLNAKNIKEHTNLGVDYNRESLYNTIGDCLQNNEDLIIEPSKSVKANAVIDYIKYLKLEQQIIALHNKRLELGTEETSLNDKIDSTKQQLDLLQEQLRVYEKEICGIQQKINMLAQEQDALQQEQDKCINEPLEREL